MELGLVRVGPVKIDKSCYVRQGRHRVEHFYKSIPGYFTYPTHYHWVAQQMTGRKSPRLVEVGVYTGQSAAFLGVELVNVGVQDAELFLVDKYTDGGSAEEVLARLSPLSGKVKLTARANDSSAEATWFDDGSLDFVFIDADHRYEGVSRDIDAWAPKVKRGGILAGHDFIDYQDFGVVRAVCERFSRFEVWPGTTDGGDAQMRGKYWPVWSVRL